MAFVVACHKPQAVYPLYFNNAGQSLMLFLNSTLHSKSPLFHFVQIFQLCKHFDEEMAKEVCAR
jgi:hypothetical protein